MQLLYCGWRKRGGIAGCLLQNGAAVLRMSTYFAVGQESKLHIVFDSTRRMELAASIVNIHKILLFQIMLF